MTEVRIFREGGYRYIQGPFQFSGGVAAESGFEIERVRLLRPGPLADGFALVEAHLRRLGRPLCALAACELRSADPFSEREFQAFNRDYVATLERWGLYRDGTNPVARTNVCPEYDKPAQASLYAFSYTVPASADSRGTFIITGGGEMRGGPGTPAERIVRHGECSPAALREKVGFVVAKMEQSLRALGFTWSDAVSTQAYTVHDIGPWWARRSPSAARRPEVCRGISRDRRWWDSSSRWTCAARRANG